VLAIKKQTMTERSMERGIVAPAWAAITGSVNTTLMAGAMWVIP